MSSSFPYLQPMSSLGTEGRSFASVRIGSNRAGAGSSFRVAAWEKNNLPIPEPTSSMPGNTPYAPNGNGGIGGGGGGGAPQYKDDGNGYGGGIGGNGLVCIYANINNTNVTPSISGFASSPLPTIPIPNSTTTATLNVTYASNSNNISSNSAYPNIAKGATSVTYNGDTYYVIYLGPGVFTIETNLSIIYILMGGGGGGGAGGAALENDNCFLGAGGGGGGAIIGTTIFLYTVEGGNDFGLNSILNVTVGSGGAGGSGGFKNPGNGQNYSGFSGSPGTTTTVTITQPDYAQISESITLTCTGGGGGQAAAGNTSNYNGIQPQGGSPGIPSVSGLSTEGTSQIFAFLSGGNGGAGSYGQLESSSTLGGNSFFYSDPSGITNFSNNVFVVPANNSEIPYLGSGATYTEPTADYAAAINMGGGGGGSSGYDDTGFDIVGGIGAGGSGGAVNDKIYEAPSITFSIFSWLINSSIGDLSLGDPSTYVSILFGDD